VIKLLSGALLFAACAYLGLQIKRIYRLKLEVFTGLLSYATALFAEISHLKTPIKEYTEFYLKGASGAGKVIIERYLKGLSAGYESVSEVAERIKLPYLNRKEEDVISDFFFRLGRNGVDGELEHLSRYIEEFKRRRDFAADTLNKEGDMYYKLAVLLGVALMIIAV
jgi:Stage III sporulation protein AB (spore_III_AB).